MSGGTDRAAKPPGIELSLYGGDAGNQRLLEQQTADIANELRSIRGVEVERVREAVPDEAKAL